MTERKWTLHDILDYETGDSWNGTHGRIISVAFDEAAKTFTIQSENAMSPGDSRAVDFTAEYVEENLPAAHMAKYFSDFFNSSAWGAYAEVMAEGEDLKRFIRENTILQHDLPVRPPLQFPKPSFKSNRFVP